MRMTTETRKTVIKPLTTFDNDRVQACLVVYLKTIYSTNTLTNTTMMRLASAIRTASRRGTTTTTDAFCNVPKHHQLKEGMSRMGCRSFSTRADDSSSVHYFSEEDLSLLQQGFAFTEPHVFKSTTAPSPSSLSKHNQDKSKWNLLADLTQDPGIREVSAQMKRKYSSPTTVDPETWDLLADLTQDPGIREVSEQVKTDDQNNHLFPTTVSVP